MRGSGMWVQRLTVAERGLEEKPPDWAWDWPWEGPAVREPFWEEEEESEEEEDDEDPGGGHTFCGLRRAFLCPEPSARLAPECPLRGFALPREQPPPRPTAEEAARNAEELLAEEERLKRRAEKKRLRRRRRKDRRRQAGGAGPVPAEDGAAAETPGREAPASAPGSGCEGGPTEESPASPGRSSGDEAEELDLSSTFVSKARLKVGSRPCQRKGKEAVPAQKEAEVEVGQEAPQPPRAQMNPVEQSLVLADCGNETAKRGGYQEAVLLFTEAVKLNPREYRFFGNRSFCYEKLQCYAEALRDAQLALSLQPGWPKGLFRQGKALMGLKRYAEAAKTFEALLRLNGSRYDAAIQLEKCRAQLLLNGFSQYNTLKWNVLTRGVQPQGAQPTSQLLMSSTSQAEGRLAPVTITSSKYRMLPPPAAPAPVRERFPVWVGNLTPQITQETLQYYFQPFGPIDSIRRLPRRFCAFVNYTSKEAAEAAFRALQGMEVEGSKFLLQLKHPVHATPVPTKAPSSP